MIRESNNNINKGETHVIIIIRIHHIYTAWSFDGKTQNVNYIQIYTHKKFVRYLINDKCTKSK